MKIKNLLVFWNEHASKRHTAQEYSVKLPLEDAARIEALREMFPGRQTTDIITDLISAALDELQEALPYVKGIQISAEDEFGDPIYEDVGPSPRFQILYKKYSQTLKQQSQNQLLKSKH